MRIFKWLFLALVSFVVIGALSDDDERPETPAAKSIQPDALIHPLPEGKDKLLDDPLTPTAFTPPPETTTAQEPKSPTASTKTLYVTGSSVNLRQQAKIANNVLGQFSKGTEVTALETRNNWTRISGKRAGKTLTGWMSSTYLSPTKPAPASTTAVSTVKKRSVAIPSNSEISKAKKEIIRQSINEYSGSCPCPFNRDRAGRRCGKRSAWSRPGGYNPICYESDVSRSRLVSHFARLGKQLQ